MKKLYLCILIYALISISYAHANWVDRSGKPIADAPDRKSIGNLGSWLVLTNKEQETFARWNTPSTGVNIHSTATIEHGEMLTALLIFSGCATDKNGNCNLIVKFKIVQPDGKIYADLPYQEAWVGKPVPPNKSLGMSISYVRLVVEPHEALGNYTVYAHVVDKNAKQEIRLASVFTVTDKAPSGR